MSVCLWTDVVIQHTITHFYRCVVSISIKAEFEDGCDLNEVVVWFCWDRWTLPCAVRQNLERFICFTQLTSRVMIHYTIHTDSVVTGVITIQLKEAQLENIQAKVQTIIIIHIVYRRSQIAMSTSVCSQQLVVKLNSTILHFNNIVCFPI